MATKTVVFPFDLMQPVKTEVAGAQRQGVITRLWVARNNSLWCAIEFIDTNGRPYSEERPCNVVTAA